MYWGQENRIGRNLQERQEPMPDWGVFWAELQGITTGMREMGNIEHRTLNAEHRRNAAAGFDVPKNFEVMLCSFA
jgi:hypothetical protein